MPDTILVDCYDQPGQSSDTSHWYRHFGTNPQYSINLDEYDPPTGAGSFPPWSWPMGAAGWADVATSLDGLATHIRDAGYIVFNIDYRLACDPGVYVDVPICGSDFSVPPMMCESPSTGYEPTPTTT